MDASLLTAYLTA